MPREMIPRHCSGPECDRRSIGSKRMAITRSIDQFCRGQSRRRRPILEPRGLSREEAAAYIGVSPSKFDDLVKRRVMPQPRALDTRRVWCRDELDEAFDALPRPRLGQTGADDPWSDMSAT